MNTSRDEWGEGIADIIATQARAKHVLPARRGGPEGERVQMRWELMRREMTASWEMGIKNSHVQ